MTPQTQRSADARDAPTTIEQLLGAMNEIVARLGEAAQPDDPLVIQPGQMWATTEQLARRYSVTKKWVAARPRELGAAPISDSSNSKLRYHLPTADRYMEGRMRGQSRDARTSRRRRARKASDPQRSGLIEFV